MSYLHLGTIGFAETRPNQHALIVQNLYIPNEMRSLQVPKEAFIQDGKTVWDLCAATTVDPQNVHAHIDRTNEYYTVQGGVFREYIPVQVLKKKYFESQVISIDKFLNDKSIRFAIVKPRKINSIYYDPGNNGRRIYLMLDFNEQNRNVKILNKDYRWKQYWNRLPNELLDEKLDFYQALFDHSKRTIYLVLYRYDFGDNTNYWIAGFHWIP